VKNMGKQRIIITGEEEDIKKIFGLLGTILDVEFYYRIENVDEKEEKTEK